MRGLPLLEPWLERPSREHWAGVGAGDGGKVHLGTVAGTHSAPARRPPTCPPPANPKAPPLVSPNLEPAHITHLK